jgi:hypothetical protein
MAKSQFKPKLGAFERQVKSKLKAKNGLNKPFESEGIEVEGRKV